MSTVMTSIVAGVALLASPLSALQMNTFQQSRAAVQTTSELRRGTAMFSTAVQEEKKTDDFELSPDLMDDPFADSGDEDLLASFDLEGTDVGEVMSWPNAGSIQCDEQRVVDRANFGRHGTDCGSPEVQIAMFTTRIKFITKHVIDNPKDHASRRGLLALVSKRRRLLHYIYSKKPDEAHKLIEDLGVRFRFRNMLPDRTEKYRQYTIKENTLKKKRK